MQKITKKIILSFFSLLLIVTVLGTSTYAWFTIGQTVMIEEFEMDVESGDGLEFAFVSKNKVDLKNNEGLEFVSILDGKTIKGLIAADYGWNENEALEMFKMKDFTSKDGKNIEEMVKPIENKDIPLMPANASNGGFVEFTLRFRTEKAALSHLVWSYVSLDSEGVNDINPGFKFPTPTFTKEGKRREVFPKSDDEYYIDYTYKAADAARIAIEGYVLDDEVANKYLNSVVVYEKEERDFEDKNEKESFYGNSVLSNNQPNFDEGNLYYFKKTYSSAIDVIHKDYRAAKTIQSLTEYYEDPEDDPIEVQIVLGTFKVLDEESEVEDPYLYTDITIRIYIEGFDAEAFNVILNDKLSIMMQFSVVADEELNVNSNLTMEELVNIIED